MRVERDVILLGSEEPTVSPKPADGSLARRIGSVAGARRLRRFVEPGLLVVSVGAMLLAVQVTGSRESPVAGPAVSPPAGSSAAPRAPVALGRLLAPQTASPGERITVLAYRNRWLCGAAEMRFDGATLAHQLASVVGPPNSDRTDMFLTMQVPRSATPGHHEIALYGPMPGGGRGQICADVGEHQAQLATTTITVAARRG